jgi:carbon-monoxide dehydrogenase medium subunit
MYPPKFDYYRASSVDEAIALRKEHGGKFLAGGHSLIPVMNLRLADPGALIDIGRLDSLKGISVDGDMVKIGSLTTHAMIADSTGVPAAMAEAAGMIGDPQVRNRGTIGGNVSHADPASDWPTVLMALGAHFRIAGTDGMKTVDAADFFTGLFETALGEDDLLVGVGVPTEGNGTGSGYAKLFNPASRYAMVGAAASVTVANGTCTAASVAVGGLTPKAVACPSVAAALVGKSLDADTIATAAAAVANDLGDDVMGDMHASADYRRSMAPVFVKRALMKAAERA